MPFGSIPDTRTSPSRMAGAMETMGHQPCEFFPAPVAPATRVWPPTSGLVPVAAVLGAPRPHLAQVDVLPAHVDEVGEGGGRR